MAWSGVGWQSWSYSTVKKRTDLSVISKQGRTTSSWLESIGGRVLSATEPKPAPSDSPKPGISRPTEAAAVAHLSGVRDWLAPEQVALLAEVAEWHRLGQSIVTRLGDLATRLGPEVVGAALCTQTGCSRRATRGGHCDACRMWLQRHPEAEVVPEAVIARR